MSSLRQQYANESIESFCFLKNGASRSFEFPLYPSMNLIIPLLLIKLLKNQKIQHFIVGKGCSNCYCSYAELVTAFSPSSYHFEPLLKALKKGKWSAEVYTSLTMV